MTGFAVLLKLLLPGLSLAAVTLLAALPWGVPADVKPVVPMLPYLVCHFWAERRERAMPDWLVFLAGLVTDVLGQGPLGFWALVFLIGYTLVRLAAQSGRPGRAMSIAVFAMTAGVLVALQWLLASLYYLRSADLLPLLNAASIALAIYAMLALVLPIGVEATRRFNDRLERGA